MEIAEITEKLMTVANKMYYLDMADRMTPEENQEYVDLVEERRKLRWELAEKTGRRYF